MDFLVARNGTVGSSVISTQVSPSCNTLLAPAPSHTRIKHWCGSPDSQVPVSWALATETQFPTSSSPQESTDRIYISPILSCQECYINRIVQNLTFRGGLLLLSILSLSSTSCWVQQKSLPFLAEEWYTVLTSVYSDTLQVKDIGIISHLHYYK